MGSGKAEFGNNVGGATEICLPTLCQGESDGSSGDGRDSGNFELFETRG